MAVVRMHLRGRTAKDFDRSELLTDLKHGSWVEDVSRENHPREGHLSPLVTTEPGMADFFNHVEVAFDLASRNCAKAREETQSGCEEEGRGAVGVLQTQALSQPGSVGSELPQTLKKGKPENERPTVNTEVLIA